MMRSGFICLLLCFSCALTAYTQSTTLTPKAAAAYWHQKKDWNTVQASPVISGAAQGQSIADYWQSTHANPNFICGTCHLPTASYGNVFSGLNPVIGAHVYLFAAATGGYGTPTAPVASISLLTSGVPDENGNYYVVTDVNGDFSINGSVACTPNQQVYAYAVGGNTSTTSPYNPNIGEMAVIGPCPSMYSPIWPPPVGTFPFISMTPVTTVAAAYALAGFAVDATDVSSSNTPLAQIGVANAFANAGNLATLVSGGPGGSAPTTTPSGNGVVPQSTIDTIANILAFCIDSPDPISIQCSALFNVIAPNGNPTGVPMDTATAAIYIAQNPGANISTLFSFSDAADQYPYSPALTAQPNDFTVGINFTIDERGADAIAIDGLGNVWIADTHNNNAPDGRGNSVTALSSTGAPLPGSPFTGGGISEPFGVAIDSNGNTWVTNEVSSTGSNSLTEIASGSTTPQEFQLSCLTAPWAIAIDSTGDLWVTNYGSGTTAIISSQNNQLSCARTVNNVFGESIAIDSNGNAWVPGLTNQNVVEIHLHASGVSTYSGDGFGLPYGVAIDSSGDVWINNYTGGASGQGSVTELNNSGTPVGNSPFTGGGLYLPLGIAMDGAGDAWLSNIDGNSVTELSNTGVPLSGTNGYTAGGTMGDPTVIAVDGSGDVWVPSLLSSIVTELIGAAAPVVTPLVVGVANGSPGSRP
jgi:hypothetical protein